MSTVSVCLRWGVVQKGVGYPVDRYNRVKIPGTSKHSIVGFHFPKQFKTANDERN